MPIKPVDAPAAVMANAMEESRLVSSGFRSPFASMKSEAEIGGQAPNTQNPSRPLPVYSISPETLIKYGSKSLPYAAQHGWRVITMNNDGDQLVDISSTSYKPISVRRGSSAAILAQASILAEKRLAADVSYEPRVLDFGRLGMSALWLHRKDGDDRFFTLETEPKEQSEQELLGEAQSRARQRIDAADQGGSAKDEKSDLPGDVGG
jgi:hypothetical protein